MTAKYPTDLEGEASGAVAERHERDGSGPRRSSYHEWLKVPPVSGFELIHVLEQIGFVLQPHLAGVASMEREGNVIDVPLSDQIDPDVLVAILKRARLSPKGLLALLPHQAPEPEERTLIPAEVR
jgi:hypothetical protein